MNTVGLALAAIWIRRCCVASTALAMVGLNGVVQRGSAMDVC